MILNILISTHNNRILGLKNIILDNHQNVVFTVSHQVTEILDTDTKEYISFLDFETLLLGTKLSLIPIINDYGGNPHNSYIMGHANIGIIYIIFIVFSLMMIIYITLFYSNTFVYTFLILIFLIRIFFDILSLMGTFDFIFYFLMFSLYEVYQKGKKRNFLKLFKKEENEQFKKNISTNPNI